MSQISTPQPPPGFVPISKLTSSAPPAAVSAPPPAPNLPLPDDSATPEQVNNWTNGQPMATPPPQAKQTDGTPTPPPGFLPVSKLSQQQTASPQDEADRQQYITDRYRETFGRSIVTGRTDLHPQVQGYMERTRGRNPNSPDGLWPVVESSAADFVRGHEDAATKAQREERFTNEWRVTQRVKQRDSFVRNAILHAYDLNGGIGGASRQLTPEQLQHAVEQYTQATPGGNLVNDPSLPPFKYSTDESGNPHVETDLTGTGVLHGLVNRTLAASADLASAIPEAVGRGVNSAEAQAFQHFNTPTGNNPYADRLAKYNQGTEELHGAMDSALPGSDFAKKHPGYGMVESGLAQVPGMVALGGVGAAGAAGKVAMYGTVAAGEYNSGYQTTYKALTAQGMKPIDADAHADAVGAANAAVNTYLMKYGALGQEGARALSPAMIDRLKAIAQKSVVGGLAQGGVGAGQNLTKQLTQYAATGDGPDAEKFLDETLQNVVTGMVSTPFMPGHGAAQGDAAQRVKDEAAQLPGTTTVNGETINGPKPGGGTATAIDNIRAALTPPPPPPDQGPAPKPKTLKEARQRAKGQLQPQPPADMQPPPAPPAQDAAQAQAEAPAPKPAPAAPAVLPDGDLTADTPERRAWLIEAMTKVPDASKWADAVQKGKLKPWPSEGPKPKEAPRANQEDAGRVSGGQPQGQGADQAPAGPDRSQAPGPVEKQAAAPAAATPDRASAGTPPADGERGSPAGAAGEDKPAAKVKRAVESARKIVPDLKPVDPKTDDQREAADVARSFGVEPVFYQSKTKGRSFVHPDHPDVMFVNVRNRASGAVREAVGHELGHNLSITDPEAMARIVNAIDPSQLSEGSKKYLDNYKQTFTEDDAKALAGEPDRMHEEGMAQVLGEAAMKEQVWRAMKGKDPTAFQKLGDAVERMVNRANGGPRIDAIAKAWKEARAKKAQAKAPAPAAPAATPAAAQGDADAPPQSKGHVEFIGEHEYFKGPNGDLYRVPADAPMGTDGYRMGARFESTPVAADARLKLARESQEARDVNEASDAALARRGRPAQTEPEKRVEAFAKSIGLSAGFTAEATRAGQFGGPADAGHINVSEKHANGGDTAYLAHVIGHELSHVLEGAGEGGDVYGGMHDRDIRAKARDYIGLARNAVGEQGANDYFSGDEKISRMRQEGRAELLGEAAEHPYIQHKIGLVDGPAPSAEKLPPRVKALGDLIDHLRKRGGVFHDVADDTEAYDAAAKGAAKASEVPTTIETPQGAVKARYKLVEADSLIPSHHEVTFRPNEKHVGGQERQYDTDRAEREKVFNNDRKFDSRHVLSDDPTPANGPPMAARDGSVIGGNSRAMVIKRVYADDARADQLRTDTLEAAKRMGISGGDALEKPVLVRELDAPVTPDNAAQLSRQLQKGLTQDMTAEADAASRGKLLLKNEKTLPALESILGDGGTVREALSKPSTTKRLIELLNDSGAMTPQETSKFLEPDGSFTEDGKKMVERVLTSSVVSDPNLLKDLPANVAAKITSNLADLAYTKTKGGGWDLTDALTKALTTYMKMRASEGVDGKALGRYAEQSQLVKDPGLDDPRARPILESLVRENTQQFKARVKAFAEDARSLDPGQSRMFGTADVTPDQAFKDAFAETTPRGGDKGLFLPGGAAAKAAGDKLSAAAKDVAQGIRDTHQDILDTIAPQGRGDKAAFTGRRAREYGGELERRRIQAQHALQGMRDYFAGRPQAEVDDFVHRIETGRAQPTKDLADMAKLARDLMDGRLGEVQALGTGKLTSFIRNYFPHFWKDTAKAESFYSRRPLEGTKDFLKKRVYQLRADGLAAGLEPLYKNPVDDLLARVHAMDKYILGQRMLAELKANGIAQFNTAKAGTPAGQARINDKIATVYGKPNRRGAVLIRGYWTAEEGAAQVINNYLSPGLREGRFGYIVKRAMGLNSLMNAANLSMSVRHAFVDSSFAVSGQIGTGLQKITEGARGLDPATVWGGVKDVATSPLAPFIDAVRGSKLLAAYADSSGGRAIYDTLADAYAKSGGRGQRMPEYENGLQNRLAETFRKMGMPEWFASPIMRGLVPRLKAGGFVRDALYEMQKAGPGMTKDELTKIGGRIADNMDHRLGEMVYDNTLWDRRFKDIAMLTTRSVGWTGGTALAAKGAAADVLQAARDVAKGKMPTIGNRLGFVIGMVATHAMAGAVVHHLLTGKNPDELKDYFYPKTGEKDAQGHDIRLSLPTYINDGRAFYNHPAQTVLNKSAPLINAIGEMLRNKDYYGTQVVNRDDNGWKQGLDYLKFFGKQFVPFSAREIDKLTDEKVPLRDKLMPLAGINTAPKELSRSKAENLAIELAGEEHGDPAPKTPEQAERYKLVRQLGDSVRLKEKGANDAVKAAYKAGKITKADIPTLRSIAEKPYVARLIEHLSADDTLKVWKVAAPDERKELQGYFVKKLRESKSISPIRAREILKQMQDAK